MQSEAPPTDHSASFFRTVGIVHAAVLQPWNSREARPKTSAENPIVTTLEDIESSSVDFHWWLSSGCFPDLSPASSRNSPRRDRKKKKKVGCRLGPPALTSATSQRLLPKAGQTVSTPTQITGFTISTQSIGAVSHNNCKLLSVSSCLPTHDIPLSSRQCIPYISVYKTWPPQPCLTAPTQLRPSLHREACCKFLR